MYIYTSPMDPIYLHLVCFFMVNVGVYIYIYQSHGSYGVYKSKLSKPKLGRSNCESRNTNGELVGFFEVEVFGESIFYTGNMKYPETNSSRLKIGAPWKFGDSYWKAHHFSGQTCC